MPHDNYVVVARVMRTHGIKGEVSVASATETPFSSLLGATVWFVPPPGGRRSATITAVRSGPKGPLVTFAGIEDIGVAKSLVGREMLAEQDALPTGWDTPQEPDRNGYSVIDETHGELGTITETIVTGANDVWVVEGSFGEVLIPIIDDVVIAIDDSARAVSVRLLPGLLPDGDDGS